MKCYAYTVRVSANGECRTNSTSYMISITLQTCPSNTSCTEAAWHTKKDEKYSLCVLSNRGLHLRCDDEGRDMVE